LAHAEESESNGAHTSPADVDAATEVVTRAVVVATVTGAAVVGAEDTGAGVTGAAVVVTMLDVVATVVDDSVAQTIGSSSDPSIPGARCDYTWVRE
jgi:hypothetical protein